MDRHEFERLRDLKGKCIRSDIEFRPDPKVSPNLVFDNVEVHNAEGAELFLNGTYKPFIPAVTFNFAVKGVGPICRLDVNGTVHGTQGRTHKHALQSDADPRMNLPQAIARPDVVELSVREIWNKLCQEANIRHEGRFMDPETGSKQ